MYIPLPSLLSVMVVCYASNVPLMTVMKSVPFVVLGMNWTVLCVMSVAVTRCTVCDGLGDSWGLIPCDNRRLCENCAHDAGYDPCLICYNWDRLVGGMCSECNNDY